MGLFHRFTCRICDHLHRSTLWDILRLRMRSSNVVDILESMYKGTQAKLDGVDAPIPVDIGVRQVQGGPESCVCFNYYFLDVVIRIALSKIEAKFPGAGIQHDYNINLECTDRSQRFENAAGAPRRARSSCTPTIFYFSVGHVMKSRG